MNYRNLISAILSSALSFASIDSAFAQTSGLPSPIDGQPTNDQPVSPGFDLGFGDDNRIPMRSSAYPWSAVGRVQIDGGGHCTGALIGKDLVLTNAHCIWSNGQRRNITFAPNYRNGQSSETARGIQYWWGTSDPNNNRRADWAIIRLERPIGDRYGWFGTQSLNYQDLRGRTVTYAGYSTFGDEKVQEFINGETAQVHVGCQIRDVYPNDGIIHTDCDNGRGGSGGPIFIWQNNQPIIIGINAAEYRGESQVSFFTQNYTPGQGNVGVPALTFNLSLPAGSFRLADETIFSSNGRDAYCTYQNMEHWSFAANKALQSANYIPPTWRNDGPCPIILPAGNYRQLDGLIFLSNGKDAFCAYRRVPSGFIRQLNAPVPYDRLMRNDGICAGQ